MACQPTPEKAAGNAAGGVGLLLIIDGEGEEILARAGFFFRHHGGEDHGVPHTGHYGPACLPGDFPGLQGDPVVTVLK